MNELSKETQGNEANTWFRALLIRLLNLKMKKNENLF